MAHSTPPPRRVLGEIGDLVTPPPRTRRRVLGELGSDVCLTRRRVLGELDVDLTPAPALLTRGASQVFRFTLKSRRALAGGETPVSGCQALSQPPRRIAVDMHRTVQICRCSRDLEPPPKKRLCGRDTDEHDEYRLLETMSSKGGFDGSLTAGRASLRELEVHFIVVPEDTVVGYVALSLQRPKMLLELYAEPEYRQTGAVEMALQFLLGDEEQIVVHEGIQEIINRNYGEILRNMTFVRTDENGF